MKNQQLIYCSNNRKPILIRLVIGKIQNNDKLITTYLEIVWFKLKNIYLTRVRDREHVKWPQSFRY